MSEILANFADLWHRFISPWLPGACRFEPTCSQYFARALREHGLIKGVFLGLRRLGRCHPWGSHGWDPVPVTSSKKGPL